MADGDVMPEVVRHLIPDEIEALYVKPHASITGQHSASNGDVTHRNNTASAPTCACTGIAHSASMDIVS